MSGSEFLVVLVAALILFGGKRLPELARSAGRLARQVRKAYQELKRQMGLDIDVRDDDDRRVG